MVTVSPLLKGDEQSDARKSPVGREFESLFFCGDYVIAVVRPPNQ